MSILTIREREIFNLLIKNKTTKDIASLLDISEKTVRNHISNVIQKLDVKSRGQAIIELMEALEVRNWEDLKGQYVRVVSQGWGGKITKIGHLIKDKWFSFEEFFEKYKGE